MVARRNNGRKNGGQRSRPPMRRFRAPVLDLTNFGQSNRRYIKASFTRDLTTLNVVFSTLGRKLVGSNVNGLIGQLFDTDNGWFIKNVRVVSVRVVFDNRGVIAAGSSGAFNARPRCGAFLTGMTPSEIDPVRIEAEIENYGGLAISPNSTRVVNVRVGPEFAVGRFGETGANELVVYAKGFAGFARVIVTYEVIGFPGSNVILPFESGEEVGLGTDVRVEELGSEQNQNTDWESQSLVEPE